MMIRLLKLCNVPYKKCTNAARCTTNNNRCHIRCSSTIVNLSKEFTGKPKTRQAPAAISLTSRAVGRIKSMIEGKDATVGVKVSVKRRGCNGYSYTMNYAMVDDLKSNDNEVVQSDGVNVLVDKKAIFFLVGTEMDYEETELSSEFTFNNPNSKGSCGCGESFNV